MEMNVNKNVIVILFDHLTMKGIFNELENLHYLNLMINDDMKINLKKKPWK